MVAITLLQPWAMFAKGPAVNEGRGVLQGLNEIRLDRLLQKNGHRPVNLEIGRRHGTPIERVGHHDASQAFPQFGQRFRKTEDGHHLRGHGDVKTALVRHAVPWPPQTDRHLPHGSIVHVHHTPPHDPSHVDSQLVAVVDVVVETGGQEIVGQFDGVNVAGEVEVDVLHGDDLGIAAAGGATLHPKAGAHRWFPKARHRLLADSPQGVGQPDAGRCLSLARRRRGNGRDEYQLARRRVLETAEQVERNLGLVFAVEFQIVVRNPQFSGNFCNREHPRLAGDFDVGGHRDRRSGHKILSCVGRMEGKSTPSLSSLADRRQIFRLPPFGDLETETFDQRVEKVGLAQIDVCRAPLAVKQQHHEIPRPSSLIAQGRTQAPGATAPCHQLPRFLAIGRSDLENSPANVP